MKTSHLCPERIQLIQPNADFFDSIVLQAIPFEKAMHRNKHIQTKNCRLYKSPRGRGISDISKKSSSAPVFWASRQLNKIRLHTWQRTWKHRWIDSNINQRLPWWVRYWTWNSELHLFVKKGTHLIRISIKLLLMRNFPADQPIIEEQSESSYAASLERKRSDDEEPWLFLGEDEDFISAAWIRLKSPKPFTPRNRQGQVAGLAWLQRIRLAYLPWRNAP